MNRHRTHNDPTVPDYLPPWPTTWPDTQEDADKIVKGVRRGVGWRTITALTATAALLAYTAPGAVITVLIVASIAVGFGAYRR